MNVHDFTATSTLDPSGRPGVRRLQPSFEEKPVAPEPASGRMRLKPLRIGFLSDSYNDPDVVGSWSGLPYHFATKMREAGCEVVAIRGQDLLGGFPERLKQVAWRLVGKRYVRGLSQGRLRAYARSVEPLLKAEGVDVVFSVNSWLLAHLETDLPTVFWTDATFASMLGFYDSFSRLAPTSLRTGREVEGRVMARASLAVYSSAWAARSAEKDHGADPARVVVLPFGANLKPLPTVQQVNASLDAKLSPQGRAVCELSCIAVEWKRKGLDLVVGAAAELERRGIRTRLRIAGCKPPKGTTLPANVELLGFLDKTTVEGQQRLLDLYRTSHFFVLPSRAEAFGVVLSEACALGVPCLATTVGGLPEVIRPGVNGQLFPLEAPAEAYADAITELWSDPVRYRQLALAAMEDYHERLCGHKAVTRLVEHMHALVQPSSRPSSSSS